VSEAPAPQRPQHGWSIGQVLPGEDAPARWFEVAGPGPLAALLSELGQWQLDGPARDLDAEHWVWRWRFERPLPVDDTPAASVLALDGLATLCEVRLNGNIVLHSDNMFVAHRLALGPLLNEGLNELLIDCRPLGPRLDERRPRPRWRVPMLRQQQLRWFRTTLLGRTPGWSPPVAPLGPWGAVWLATPQALLNENLRLRPRVVAGRGVLDLRLPAAALAAAALAPGAEVSIELARGAARHATTLLPQADGSLAATLFINNVSLWWPHTHGEPALYDACLVAAGRRLALAPVGFRSIELRRGGDGRTNGNTNGHANGSTNGAANGPANGHSDGHPRGRAGGAAHRDAAAGADSDDFELCVNGVPVFARGACWTPLDPLRLHANAADYAAAIAQVRGAGMNMLRVAGPLVYEHAAFFDACDAHGVLVWQDFMFANMDYPEDDPGFMQSVHTEVQQQLARWQGRACLAVLCGNSEVEQQAAMCGAPRALWAPALFHQTLPAWCAQALPDTPYWPSSAHGGTLPCAPDSGTSSYYGVGAYQRDASDARSSGLRFATECLAFAQLPEAEAADRLPGGRGLRAHHPAWKERSPRDLGAGWDFDDVRDHYAARMFGADMAALRYSDHERYLMLGRVALARTTAAAFSQWRSQGSRCRGALVWFLRDLWSGAGWGLLDARGDPKSAWHALAGVLQPTALLLTDEGLNGLRLHLVNEGASALAVQLELATWRGEQRLLQVQRDELLAPRSARALPVPALFDHFTDFSWAYRFGPPPYELLVATLRAADDGRVLAEASHLCAGWNGGLMADPGLRARCRRVAHDTLQVELHTQRTALAVHFDVEGHVPAQAYFDLPPGGRRTVLLQRRAGAPARALRGSVLAVNAAAPVALEQV
jgi:beta-mannosidase